MAIKLKSVFHSQQLRLAVKALIFGGFLVLAKIGHLGLFPILFFLFMASFLYFKPLFNPLNQLNAFILLMAISVFFARILNNFDYFLISAGFAALLFYVILGIKDLVLIRREVWSRFVYLSIILASAFLFFNSQAFSGLLPKLVLLFFGYYLVFRGVLRDNNFSFAAALVLAELSLLARLLPLTSLNAANLILLTYFILIEFMESYLNQSINRRVILTNITIFIIIALLIFATTGWSLIL